MKKRLYNLKKGISEYEKTNPYGLKYIREEYLDDEGNAVIDVNMEGNELYNPLTLGKQRELNSDIYEMIDEKAYMIPVEYPIILNFYGVCESDREHVEALVREHYGLLLRDKKNDLRINCAKWISMFVIGGILLALYFVLANFGVNEVWYEIFSIVATFIVWEGADYAILERRSLKIAYYDAAQMVLSKIRFCEEDMNK